MSRGAPSGRHTGWALGSGRRRVTGSGGGCGSHRLSTVGCTGPSHASRAMAVPAAFLAPVLLLCGLGPRLAAAHGPTGKGGAPWVSGTGTAVPSDGGRGQDAGPRAVPWGPPAVGLPGEPGCAGTSPWVSRLPAGSWSTTGPVGAGPALSHPTASSPTARSPASRLALPQGQRQPGHRGGPTAPQPRPSFKTPGDAGWGPCGCWGAAGGLGAS